MTKETAESLENTQKKAQAEADKSFAAMTEAAQVVAEADDRYQRDPTSVKAMRDLAKARDLLAELAAYHAAVCKIVDRAREARLTFADTLPQ